jgi:hypothetical protein
MHFVQKHCTFSKLVSCKVIGPPRLVEKADEPATQAANSFIARVSVFQFCLRDNSRMGRGKRKERIALEQVG